MPTSNFQPIRLLDPDFCYKFAYLMANSADPDLHCLQNRVYLGSAGQGLITMIQLFRGNNWEKQIKGTEDLNQINNLE